MNSKFRRFRITRMVPESSNITSLYFAPIDGEALWPALPGQYVTLKVPVSTGTLIRTYSISNDVSSTSELRITVKKEIAPVSSPNAPPGQCSHWLHNTASVGSEIEIAPPRGNFVLDQESLRPVILLSGGVGQTPLLSMLHTLVDSNRSVWYLHACENTDVHAMHSEVNALTNGANKKIDYHVCYKTPPNTNATTQHNQSQGFIDKTLLQSLLPLDDYDCYVCGPIPFMVAMYKLLRDLGIAEQRIAYEFFGKSLSLPSLVAQLENEEAGNDDNQQPAKTESLALTHAPAALLSLTHLINPAARAVTEEPASIEPRHVAMATDHNSESSSNVERVDNNENTVVFAASDVTVKWENNNLSILDLAEQAGLSPEFSCRSGICNTCLCTIREGEIEYIEEPLEQPENGKVLICCSRPRGRVVLDL